MKLELDDLLPAEATLSLSEKPGKTYALSKISLRVKIWINQRFGIEKVQSIFADQHMAEISEIAYFVLKDKTDFPTLDSFRDAVVTAQDLKNLIEALMRTIGISEPVFQKLAEEYDKENSQGNGSSLSPPTGAPSTTP